MPNKWDILARTFAMAVGVGGVHEFIRTSNVAIGSHFGRASCVLTALPGLQPNVTPRPSEIRLAIN